MITVHLQTPSVALLIFTLAPAAPPFIYTFRFLSIFLFWPSTLSHLCHPKITLRVDTKSLSWGVIKEIFTPRQSLGSCIVQKLRNAVFEKRVTLQRHRLAVDSGVGSNGDYQTCCATPCAYLSRDADVCRPSHFLLLSFESKNACVCSLPTRACLEMRLI